MANTLIPRLNFLFQSFYRANKTCPHCKSAETPSVARKPGSTTDRPSPAELKPPMESNLDGTDRSFRDRSARIRGAVDGDRLLEIGSSWGFFDSWQNLPAEPREGSTGGQVMLMARKQE